MTKMMMRPAVSLTGRDGGRMMPSRTGSALAVAASGTRGRRARA